MTNGHQFSLLCGLQEFNTDQSVFFILFCFVFRDRVSLCSPGCPEIHSVDQAGLKLRDLLTCLSSAGIKGIF